MKMNTIRTNKYIYRTAVFLLFLACFFSMTFSARAAADVSIWLPVKQTVKATGTTVSTDKQAFDYRLTASEDGAPMPEGSSGNEYILTMTGQQDVKIQIDYSAEGTYTYRMKQVIDESRSDITYDDEEYLVTVQIKRGNSGDLVEKVFVQKESNKMKVSELSFVNICEADLSSPHDNVDTDSERPGLGDRDSREELLTSSQEGRTGIESEITDSSRTSTEAQSQEAANGVAAGTAAGLGDTAAQAADEGNTGEGLDLEELDSEATPRGLRNTDAWALANLLLAIATVICTLILGIAYLAKKDKSEESSEETTEEKAKRHGALRILSVVISAASVIFFLLTEDVTLPLRLTDQYTWIMALGFLLQIIDIVCIRMSGKEKKEDKAYT